MNLFFGNAFKRKNFPICAFHISFDIELRKSYATKMNNIMKKPRIGIPGAAGNVVQSVRPSMPLIAYKLPAPIGD